MPRLFYKKTLVRLLAIDPREVGVERRGFRQTAQSVHLESVGRSFLLGYHTALRSSEELLHTNLVSVGPLYRGFAFEGASMAIGLLSALRALPTSSWPTFLTEVADSHCYVAHVGLGWAWARLPWLRRSADRLIDQYDPLLRWLILDGFGFHEGYFHWRKWLQSPFPLPNWNADARHVFDQGLGRSLWFVGGADVHNVTQWINSLPLERRADLWSGLGLAVTYAGHADQRDLHALMEAAGDCTSHFCQGVTFAAEARMRAGIPADHTELACQMTCGLSASQAAQLTWQARPSDLMSRHSYQHWRSNIRQALQARVPA